MNELKNEQEIIRMVRTINGAVEEIKKTDPETPVNADMLRRWIRSGKLKHTKSGNKYLIDMDVLIEFLRGE